MNFELGFENFLANRGQIINQRASINFPMYTISGAHIYMPFAVERMFTAEQASQDACPSLIVARFLLALSAVAPTHSRDTIKHQFEDLSGLQQQSANFLMASARCGGERRIFSRADDSERVGILTDQQFDNSEVAAAGCEVERGDSVVASLVHFAFRQGANECSHSFEISACSSKSERCLTTCQRELTIDKQLRLLCR